MNYSLKPWNTFGINRYAKRIVFARTTEQLLSLWKNATKHRQPVIVLGEGSNVLFLDDFSGTVIINRIMGINVTEDDMSLIWVTNFSSLLSNIKHVSKN